jgi:hypothetical protein
MQASRPGAVASASDGGTGATPLPTPRFLKPSTALRDCFRFEQDISPYPEGGGITRWAPPSGIADTTFMEGTE